jgi:aryl-alcohol dehydrogenase-like predicted oxidoreductase
MSSDRQIIEGLRFGLELGLNFIDTAEIYGGGHTERLIGQAISGRRSEVIIATKFSPENSQPKEIIKSAYLKKAAQNLGFRGVPGLGKTDGIFQVAEELRTILNKRGLKHTKIIAKSKTDHSDAKKTTNTLRRIYF